MATRSELLDRDILQRKAARAMLAALRSARLMLHAWKGQRENMRLGPHPELEREIIAAETALAQAEAAGIVAQP